MTSLLRCRKKTYSF